MLEVERVDGGWTASRDGAVMAEAAGFTVPNGTATLVFRSGDAEGCRAIAAAAATHFGVRPVVSCSDIDTAGLERLRDAGFVERRREHLYRLPTDPATTGLTDQDAPEGWEFRTADRVPAADLRALDEELREDVPGAEGWRWDEAAFHAETHGSPDYDPQLYRVAVHLAGGAYGGLSRVWNRSTGPRLGMIAVTRPFRRHGLATRLLAQNLHVLHGRGHADLTAEVDTGNIASNALMERISATRTGGEVYFDWGG